MSECYLNLRGLRAPVLLAGGEWRRSDFSGFLPNWPFEISENSTQKPFAAIAWLDGRYHFDSDFADEPSLHTTLVNGVCDIIAHAARQRTVEQPDDLCLHAAAVEIGGGLVVFPALRRAGKSVMTAALAARGYSVFGDDVLPVSAVPGAPFLGQATGAAIRLRRPLPDNLPDWLYGFAKSEVGPNNRQYAYVGGRQVAPNGTTAPLRALIRLEYATDGATVLSPMPKTEMLKSLFKQNFGRGATADRILTALFTLANTLPSYHLRYADLDAAISLISEAFENESVPVVNMPPVPDARQSENREESYHSDLPLRQHPEANLIHLENEAFAVSADQFNVMHFDEGTLRLWALFEQPTSEIDVVEILQAAFPDVAPERLQADAERVVRKFWRTGLVEAA